MNVKTDASRATSPSPSFPEFLSHLSLDYLPKVSLSCPLSWRAIEITHSTPIGIRLQGHTLVSCRQRLPYCLSLTGSGSQLGLTNAHFHPSVGPVADGFLLAFLGVQASSGNQDTL